MYNTVTQQKSFSGLGVKPFLSNVFGIAETELEVYFTPSRKVFDVISKSLRSRSRIKNNSSLGVRPDYFTPSCKNVIIQAQLARYT